MTSARWGSLPFAEQIDFFRQKLNIDTDAWTDVYAGEHDRAFMVAGARGDVLTDFRAAIDGFIADGRTLGDFRKDFDQIVAKHGWAYTGGRNWRTRIIYETNLRQSYNAGREAQMADPALRKLRPYGLYRHGGSAEPREQHLAWDGLVLPLDDPWWNTHSPQNGWGCTCKKFTVSSRDVQRMGLTVADTAPPIEWETKEVGKRGPSPRVVRVPKGIDPGFEYRPGADWIRAMTPRPIDGPPPVIVGATGPKPSMPAPRALATPALPKGLTEAEAAQAFLDALGAQGRRAFVYRDVLDEALPLSGDLFKDYRGAWKIQKEGRDQWLHVLADTLSDPDEIWVAWQTFGTKGPTVLRRRYIRVLPGDEDGVAVFEFGKGSWREITIFHVTDAIARKYGHASAREYIESQRNGLRIYVREDNGP